jgi:hypothetical protein
MVLNYNKKGKIARNGEWHWFERGKAIKEEPDVMQTK